MTAGARSPGEPAARSRWWFAAICAVALLVYGRTFTSPFQLDDYAIIVDKDAVQEPSFERLLRFGRARILPVATFALNHRLGGEDPFGYHVINFLIHLLATLAVYRLVLALCDTPRLRETWLATQPLPLAAAAAFIFACHPIQIQAVTYVVQRMSSMAALFYVGSVALYVQARNAQLGLARGRPALAYAGSALSALAAFLSKENSASLPLAILLAEWTFYPGKWVARRLLRLAPFAVLMLVIPLLWYLLGTAPKRVATPGDSLTEQARYLVKLLTFRAHPRGEVTALQYFLTQCMVIPSYLRLVVLPWGFNIDHDVPPVQGPSPAVLAGFAFLAALLSLGLYALRRSPLLGFGIVWLFLALSVESSFFPIQDAMVEHRMYLAMPGVALALAVPFAWALHRWRVPVSVAGAALASVLCALTFLRNEVWRDPLALWQDALAKSPNKARVYANVGTALHHRGKLDEAIEHYCKALALDPKSGRAEANIFAALEEKMDEDTGDEPILLERLPVGANGEIEVTFPHPCPPGR
jgi:tetratricopeptide (TPR) repeat protein